MSTQQGPAAGWYNDPQMVNTRRYWDGEKWTEHRQETTAPATASPVDRESQGAVTAGLLFAIFIPFIGLLIGLALIGRRSSEAVGIILLSVMAFLVWYAILTA